MNAIDLFEKIKLEFSLSEEAYKLVNQFYLYIKEENSKYNLISRKNFERNFLSLLSRNLSYAAFLYPYNSFIDVGSGGGFPFIPLKIFNPNAFAILIESSMKKSFFLNSLIKKLNLCNIRLINSDFKRAFLLLKKEKIKVDYIISLGIKKKEKIAKAISLTNKGFSFITGINELDRLKNIKYLAKYKWEIKKDPNIPLYFVLLKEAVSS